MKNKIKYINTYVNTVYANFTLQYNNELYFICVDYSGGIQDISIENDEFLTNKEVKEIEAIVEDAINEQDLTHNIYIQ